MLIDKKQSLALLLNTLDAAASAGISIVVNYITGFPGMSAEEESQYLELTRREITARSDLRAKLEHNTFQLERMSPMGLNPAAHGLRVTQTWPWSSIMAWETAPATHTREVSVGGRRSARLPVISAVERRAGR